MKLSKYTFLFPSEEEYYIYNTFGTFDFACEKDIERKYLK